MFERHLKLILKDLGHIIKDNKGKNFRIEDGKVVVIYEDLNVMYVTADTLEFIRELKSYDLPYAEELEEFDLPRSDGEIDYSRIKRLLQSYAKDFTDLAERIEEIKIGKKTY